MQELRKLVGAPVMCMMLAMFVVACGEDEPTTTPVGATDMGTQEDMAPEEDMTEPDMAPDMTVDMAPDMAEPDMTEEVDMALDPMLSGTWQLKKYENEAATGDALFSFELMNTAGEAAVLGSFTQGDTVQGSVSGTFVSETLSLEWTVDETAQTHQFVNGKVEGATIVGTYNDPALGGIPQSGILVRP